ncbi:MAG: bifunctional diguanylate cyclase/phosphodiesterase [Acidobacteriota bacterium]|nr:bifunctional diguanylate cyclase/phosphodiesterase [Acidobacteriota bacterium]
MSSTCSPAAGVATATNLPSSPVVAASSLSRAAKSYLWAVIAIGVGVCVFSMHRLMIAPIVQHDGWFVLLVVGTIFAGHRLIIQIPKGNGELSVVDALIFLVMLLYGGEAAILLASAEAVYSKTRFNSKRVTILFAGASLACSTFVTVGMLHFCFGGIVNLLDDGYSARYAAALCVMALAQYIANTVIVAIGVALKNRQPIWHTWTRYYLWTSITYLAGAAAAGISALLVRDFGFYAVAFAAPVIGIVYLTYRMYLKNVEASVTQAAQSERHVAELSHHIAEQERIGRELQESKEHFRHAALHDALTGLPNRVLLKEKLQLAIERAGDDGDYRYAVLFFDLDRFKIVNDSLGHAAGDRLIGAVAGRLMKSVRATDTVARLGGDEFAMLLDGLDDWDEAARITARIQHDLTLPFKLNGHEIRTTSSIGIATSAILYEHPEDVLRDADAAMYRAKDDGKACYAMFDRSMHARALTVLQTESELRRAIEHKEFCVYYQPIFSLKTRDVSGFEALVRWRHPERGMVSPAEFIPLAEETGLIADIGNWVLREACRQLRRWQEQLPAGESLTMSVNLSCKQLSQPDLVEQVSEILQETGIGSGTLLLEITESAMMNNIEAALSTLRQLQALGVALSIDDFGTGYSSLSYLHRFPAAILKIDRSFVSRIGSTREDAAIVRTIKTLADELGMSVVAEGVETEEQLWHLEALGCKYVQGYLFAKPLDAEAASCLLREHALRLESSRRRPDENFVTALPRRTWSFAA